MPRRGRSRKRGGTLPLAVVLACAAAAAWWASRVDVDASQGSAGAAYEILARHPHDINAYTQGLYYEDGFLFEGTGRNGESRLRKVDIASGRILQEAALPFRFFGEGIAALDSRIFQLTWTSGQGFVYDKATFRQIGQFRYPGEGWGLTTDGEHLILSDGTPWLRFMDPVTFAEVRRVEVRGPRGPVEQLNELEFAHGSVYANVWFSNSVLQIDPASGDVLREIDFTALERDARPRDREAVLNGIAYDAEGDRWFLTGKLWPTVYEVRLEAP